MEIAGTHLRVRPGADTWVRPYNVCMITPVGDDWATAEGRPYDFHVAIARAHASLEFRMMVSSMQKATRK